MDFIESLCNNPKDDDQFMQEFSLFGDGSALPELFPTEQPAQVEKSEVKQTPIPPSSQELTDRIEEIILSVVRDLAEDKAPVLRLRTTHWNNCTYDENIVTMKPVAEAQMSEIRFGCSKSRRKFSVIIHLLSKIYLMLQSGSTCTRRELYYQNEPLLRSQSVVDHAMRDICCLLNAPSWSLGVNATSKGLVAGDLTLITSDSKELVCSATGGVLLPQNIYGIQFVKSFAKFVLIIEKDATFQKLLNDGAPQKLGPCILITGKGFPDVNTRLMVKRLWQDLQIPMYALVDADPHGIEIMCTYRFGSLALSHQSDYLAVPSVRWLGIHPADIKTLSVPTLPATSDDIAKLRTLMCRSYIRNHPDILGQIEILLAKQYKAEIEGVDCLSCSYLTDAYLPNKMLYNETF